MKPIMLGALTALALVGLGSIAVLLPHLFSESKIRRRLIAEGSDVDGTVFEGSLFAQRPVPSGLLTTVSKHGGAILLVACAAVLLSAGVVAALTVGLIGKLSLLAGGRIQEANNVARYEKYLPIALDSIARSLRSGAGLETSLSEAARANPNAIGADLARIVRRTQMGAGLSAALADWTEHKPFLSVKLCAAALDMAMTAGGPQAQAIDSVSRTLRQRLNSTAIAQSHATESRMSAYLLSFLPIVVSGPVLATNVHSRHFMFHTVMGSALLAVGIAFDLLGLWWMSRLIKKVVP